MYVARPAAVALAALAASILFSGTAHAQAAAPSLTGSWRFSVTTDAGTGTPAVTFRQQGDSLSGSYSSQVFGDQPIRGTVKDRDFNFAFTSTIQGTTLTVTYRGTIVSADSLSGQLTLGELGNGTFTAKRQPAGAASDTSTAPAARLAFPRPVRPLPARHMQPRSRAGSERAGS